MIKQEIPSAEDFEELTENEDLAFEADLLLGSRFGALNIAGGRTFFAVTSYTEDIHSPSVKNNDEIKTANELGKPFSLIPSKKAKWFN